MEQLVEWGELGFEFVKLWLLLLVVWLQFGLLVVVWIVVVLVNWWVKFQFEKLLIFGDGKDGIVIKVCLFLLFFLLLLLLLLVYVFIVVGESVICVIFGFGVVIVFGKCVFLFFVVCVFVWDILQDSFFKFLGKFVFILVGVFYVIGLLEFIVVQFEVIVVFLGNMLFDLFWVFKFGVVGGIIFWFG